MAGDIAVRRVTGHRMQKTFVMFPWTSGIYDNDPAWVPPVISDQMKFLNPKKGYFFEIGEAEFFLAYQNGRPIGRITTQVNHLYEKKYDNPTANTAAARAQFWKKIRVASAERAKTRIKRLRSASMANMAISSRRYRRSTGMKSPSLCMPGEFRIRKQTVL